MMTSGTQDYKCCMCGDHGLIQELFRCKVCHFRSQHRYCSNLYPKAESYSVCNWCLIKQDDDNLTTTTTTITSNNSSSNSSSPKQKLNNLSVRKVGPGHKSSLPISPIKKPLIRSTEPRSPSGGKRITAVHDRLRRIKSSIEMSNNCSSTSLGGPAAVIKQVFRNRKMRRYKLLDEVSG